MVVWERELSQGQICRVPVRSQFSSEGCCTWVRTSTVCSPLASTSVLVEKRPKSAREGPEGRPGRGKEQEVRTQLTLSLLSSQVSDRLDIGFAEFSTGGISKNPSPTRSWEGWPSPTPSPTVQPFHQSPQVCMRPHVHSTLAHWRCLMNGSLSYHQTQWKII